MVDAELLAILVCPENKTPVTPADDALVAKVNELIAAGGLKYRNGEPVGEAIEGGLVREDGAYLYAIRDDIPVMLIDESIPLEQIG
ncbi:MAG: Trm112 family protein [Candidatus Hydrogenedens sp.]|nr:Trm112 family protein [Candidatus Hydrogenedens sp.]